MSTRNQSTAFNSCSKSASGLGSGSIDPDDSSDNEEVSGPRSNGSAAEPSTSGNKNNCNGGSNNHNRMSSSTEVKVASITLLEEDMDVGIVDRFYKFSPHKFGKCFRLGDRVTFRAEEQFDEENDNYGWVITQMSHCVSDAEIKAKENKCFATHIATVVSFQDLGSVVVSVPKHDNICIPKSNLPTDYDVRIGDFLEVKLEQLADDLPFFEASNTRKYKIISVLPSKIKPIVCGVVSKDVLNHIIIDDHILITQDFLTDPDFPKIGDSVDGTAVESTQENKRFSWRVIKMSPSEFDKYSEETAEECEERDSLNESMLAFIDRLQLDKYGITIYPAKQIRFSNIKLESSVEREVTIVNKSRDIHYLRNVQILHDQRTCKFEVKIGRSESKDIIATLMPGGILMMKIKCTALLMGRTKDLCTFDFGKFKIGRYISAKGVPIDGDMNMISELTINKGGLYKKNKAWKTDEELKDLSERDCVRGIPAIRRAFFLPNDLPANFHPQCVYESLRDNNPELLYAKFSTLAGTDLTNDIELTFIRYKEMFQVGLWCEELENQLLRDGHKQTNVILCPTVADGMYFEIPTLQEFQPSVSLGEKMRVYCAEETHDKNIHGKIFEAQVSKISENKLFGKFDHKFQENYQGTPMTIEFKLSRTSYQRAHYAVEKAPTYLGENWLFPKNIEVKPARFTFLENEDATEDADENLHEDEDAQKGVTSYVIVRKQQERFRPSKKSKTVDGREVSLYPVKETSETPELENDVTEEVKLKWFKTNLNEEQKNTVRRILRGQCRSVPYIIFGPPGTGKTITVVEAVMQVHKLDKKSRILVTAPSNAAADLIAEYMVASGQYRPGDFVRFNGYQRDKITIPDTIIDFCLDGDDLQSIARNRIIISTCNNTGQFIRLKITAGHFTHVFLDEAGYCHEPDAIIPALFISLDKKGQFIMAGDPNQLGPSLTSSTAAHYGLETSFLERLMKLPPYQRDPITKKYNEFVLTKLLRNYRSHELILKLPSKLLYEDELIPTASRDETEKMCHKLDFLPKKGIPLIFHGVRGDEAKDIDNPSWYNAFEVVEVISYVKKLMNNGCTANDIGIITPYRKQVEKIRKGIEKELKCQIPKIGSINEFQGGERDVIILSLVRSRDVEDKALIQPNQFQFLFSIKRFNVSITRAKSMLIVIGNPHLFATNDTWSKFIKYCVDLKVYIGCDLPLIHNEPFRKSLYEPAKAEDQKPYTRPTYDHSESESEPDDDDNESE